MFQRLRGFRDIYPEEMRARRIVFDKIYFIARSFGFHEIDAPSVELLDLFRVKSGEEIVKQTFSFVDKGGREITLIPELTPTVARMLVARKNIVKPVKWFSMPKMWRYEEPQSGRLREFYQFNADIFGSDKIYADAEIIALAMEILDSLGLEGKYVMKVSDRILMEYILQDMGVKNIEGAFRIIDKKDKMSEDEFAQKISEYVSDGNVDELLRILNLKGDFENVLQKFDYERIESLLQLGDILKSYNKKPVWDFSVVRGLAYYTGIVFEAHDYLGELRAILGGGRYDNVVELFGGQKTPAVGFGMGDAVLELLMKREGVWPEEKISVDYYIAVVGDAARKTAIKIASELRKRGFSVDIDVVGRSLSKQMKYASKINARKVIIVGDDEIKKGKVIERDMNTGVQTEIDIKIYL